MCPKTLSLRIRRFIFNGKLATKKISLLEKDAVVETTDLIFVSGIFVFPKRRWVLGLRTNNPPQNQMEISMEIFGADD